MSTVTSKPGATLEGSLEEFPLDAVIAMLSRSGQIGGLEVSAPGLADGPATIWFGEGNVHVPSREEAVETLFQLLVTGGAFAFRNADAVPPGLDEVIPAGELLGEVEDRLAEWRVIAELIPSTAVVLRMTPALPPDADQLVLSRDEWEVLAHVDGVRSVAELTRAIGVGAFEICRLLHGLRMAGAVEPVEGPVEDR